MEVEVVVEVEVETCIDLTGVSVCLKNQIWFTGMPTMKVMIHQAAIALYSVYTAAILYCCCVSFAGGEEHTISEENINANLASKDESKPSDSPAPTSQTFLTAKLGRSTFNQIAILLVPIYIVTALNKYNPLPHFLFKGLKRSIPPSAQDLFQFSKQKRLESNADGSIKDFIIPASSPILLEKRNILISEIWSLKYIEKITSLLIVAFSSLLATTGLLLWGCIARAPLNFNSAAFFLALLGIYEIVRVLFILGATGGRFEISITCGTRYILTPEAVADVLVTFIRSGVVGFGIVLFVWLFAGSRISIPGDQIYTQFIEDIQLFLENAGVDADFRSGAPKYKFIQLLVSVLGGVLAALLTFPSFRYSRSLLLHLSFIGPLFLVTLFIGPTTDMIVGWLAGHLSPWIRPHLLVILRGVVASLVVALRLASIRTQLQAYLDIAQDRIASLELQVGDQNTANSTASPQNATVASKSSKKKSRKEEYSNRNTSPNPTISAGAVQQMVTNIWDYAGVAVLQLIVPPLLIFFGTMLMVISSMNQSLLKHKFNHQYFAAYSSLCVKYGKGIGAVLIFWASTVTAVQSFLGYTIIRSSNTIPTL
eukprot:gene11074-3140_t